jgi:hypothetical protein
MAVLGLQNANERQGFLIAAVLGVIGAVLIALAPAKLSVERSSAADTPGFVDKSLGRAVEGRG